MGNIKDALEECVEVDKAHICICSDGCNTCDKCGVVEPVTELVWDSDDEWWDSKWAKQNKYVALCEACFN